MHLVRICKTGWKPKRVSKTSRPPANVNTRRVKRKQCGLSTRQEYGGPVFNQDCIRIERESGHHNERVAMFEHILVPTDGSNLSQAAASRAVVFAKEIGARVAALGAQSEAPVGYYGEGVEIVR